ncbi:MAG: hypothetical protein ACOYIK_01470 [Coriobacteriales bacterium]
MPAKINGNTQIFTQYLEHGNVAPAHDFKGAHAVSNMVVIPGGNASGNSTVVLDSQDLKFEVPSISADATLKLPSFAKLDVEPSGISDLRGGASKDSSTGNLYDLPLANDGVEGALSWIYGPDEKPKASARSTTGVDSPASSSTGRADSKNNEMGSLAVSDTAEEKDPDRPVRVSVDGPTRKERASERRSKKRERKAERKAAKSKAGGKKAAAVVSESEGASSSSAASPVAASAKASAGSALGAMHSGSAGNPQTQTTTIEALEFATDLFSEGAHVASGASRSSSKDSNGEDRKSSNRGGAHLRRTSASAVRKTSDLDGFSAGSGAGVAAGSSSRPAGNGAIGTFSGGESRFAFDSDAGFSFDSTPETVADESTSRDDGRPKRKMISDSEAKPRGKHESRSEAKAEEKRSSRFGSRGSRASQSRKARKSDEKSADRSERPSREEHAIDMQMFREVASKAALMSGEMQVEVPHNSMRASASSDDAEFGLHGNSAVDATDDSDFGIDGMGIDGMGIDSKAQSDASEETGSSNLVVISHEDAEAASDEISDSEEGSQAAPSANGKSGKISKRKANRLHKRSANVESMAAPASSGENGAAESRPALHVIESTKQGRKTTQKANSNPAISTVVRNNSKKSALSKGSGKSKAEKQKGSSARRIKNWAVSKARVIVAVVAVVAVVGVVLYPAARDYYIALRDYDKANTELALVNDRNNAISDGINQMKTDAGIEDYVREQYGWVKSGENSVTVKGLSEETTSDTAIPATVDTNAVTVDDAWYNDILDAFFFVNDD